MRYVKLTSKSLHHYSEYLKEGSNEDTIFRLYAIEEEKADNSMDQGIWYLIESNIDANASDKGDLLAIHFVDKDFEDEFYNSPEYFKKMWMDKDSCIDIDNDELFSTNNQALTLLNDETS